MTATITQLLPIFFEYAQEAHPAGGEAGCMWKVVVFHQAQMCPTPPPAEGDRRISRGRPPFSKTPQLGTSSRQTSGLLILTCTHRRGMKAGFPIHATHHSPWVCRPSAVPDTNRLYSEVCLFVCYAQVSAGCVVFLG